MTNTKASVQSFPLLFAGDFCAVDPAVAAPAERGVVFRVIDVPGFGSRRQKMLIENEAGKRFTADPVKIVAAPRPAWADA